MLLTKNLIVVSGGAMNRNALTSAEKDTRINMTSSETNTVGTVAEQGANVASEKASSKKAATRKKGAREGRKTAKGGKTRAATPKKEAKATRKAAKPAPAKKLELRAPRAKARRSWR